MVNMKILKSLLELRVFYNKYSHVTHDSKKMYTSMCHFSSST